MKKKRPIRTWQKFAREIRSKGCHLLRTLDKFPNSILVTGCQRSGTTALARLINQSDRMVNYWVGKDDELDAALILSGYVEYESDGRYCFQTTYLNECYLEYFQHDNSHTIIWVLRNPFSVVYSLLHNWSNFGLNELFRGCGVILLNEKEKRMYEIMGVWGVSRLKRACLSYNGKISQMIDLKKRMIQDKFIVVEYDSLVTKKTDILPLIYRSINIPYISDYSKMINPKSVNKSNMLSNHERIMIDKYCMPIYEKAKRLTDYL